MVGHTASIDHRAHVQSRNAAVYQGSSPRMALAAEPPTRHGFSRFSFANGWLLGHFIGGVLYAPCSDSI